MGREIRRVAKGWVHPRREEDIAHYQPLHDESYLEASNQWVKDHQLWLAGKHPDIKKYKLDTKEYPFWASWSGYLGMPEEYRPYWEPEEMTCYQLYETVSEGTPLSPVFKTKKALAAWLTNNKDYWGRQWTKEQAEAMVAEEYAPSGLGGNGRFMGSEEAVEYLHRDKVSGERSTPALASPSKSNSGEVKS